MLKEITSFFEGILLYPIFGYIPFIVLWLALIGIFMTFKLKFINISLLPHAIKLIMRGKKSDGKDLVSPFASLMASISATVGLGSLAGTAVAISVAGPGTIFWMIVFGLLGMCVKAAEVQIGHKYRIRDANGKITGGAFLYLSTGLSDIGMQKLGAILAVMFGIFGFIAIGGMAGFQMNQLLSLIVDEKISILDNVLKGDFNDHTKIGIASAITISGFVLYVLVGGVKRVGKFASIIVPIMFMIYISSAAVVLFINFKHLMPSIQLIISSAFDFSSGLAGFITVVVIGARRGLYACESGQGTAPIANSNSSMEKSEEQGLIALLDPLLVSLIMLINGLVIVSTGVFTFGNVDGILLTKLAFSSVNPLFAYIVTVCAIMFAFTTIMTDAYYYEKFASYLFPKLNLHAIQISYSILILFFGTANVLDLLSFIDIFVLLMTIPNILGLYLLSNQISKDFTEYKQSLKKVLEK